MTKRLINSLPPPTATYKGHMHQNRRNLQSMRSNSEAIWDARLDICDTILTQEACATHKLDAFFHADLTNARNGTIYTNLTDPFPTISIRNMQYVFVCCTNQPNAIIVIPMMVAAYKEIYDYLTAKVFTPHLNVTDNECSRYVQTILTPKMLIWNLWRPINTASTPPSAPSKFSRTTSLMASPLYMFCSH